MKLTPRNGRIIGEGGYRAGFAAEAHKLGGTWDPVRKVWSFDARRRDEVKALAIQFYGAVLVGSRRSLSGGPRQSAYSDLAKATRVEMKARRSQARQELLSQRQDLMSQIDEINAKLAAL